MKKLLLLSVFIPSTAFAGWTPYVGIDAQRTDYDYNSDYDYGGGVTLDGNAILEDSLNGLNIHVGNKFNEYVGVELGIFKNKDESKATETGDDIGSINSPTDFTTKAETRGITLDALGYYPIHEKFDLIGTVGVSYTDAKFTLDIPGIGSDSVDESEFGLRAGAGGQFNINEQVNVRALARYQQADFDGIADDAIIYSLGMNYSF